MKFFINLRRKDSRENCTQKNKPLYLTARNKKRLEKKKLAKHNLIKLLSKFNHSNP